MSDERQVGRVLGSEHSNTSAFRVVLDDHDFLQLDDLTFVAHEASRSMPGCSIPGCSIPGRSITASRSAR